MGLIAATPPHLQMSWPEALGLAAACAIASALVAFAGRRRMAAVALREIAIVVGLFGMWQVVRIYAITQVAGGLANGERVWHAERSMRLPSEIGVQRLVLPHPMLVEGSNLYYLYLHFTGMTIFLGWLFWRHREHYARWRTTLVLTTAACLAVQFVPVAPPRFLPGEGFVDTAVVYGQSVYGRMNTGIADQLSAMPSVHFAWAALIAGGVVSAARSRWRWVAVAHPALTLFTIVATANHYWLDAVVAGVLLAAAWAVREVTLRALARRPAPALPLPAGTPAGAAGRSAGTAGVTVPRRDGGR